MMPPKPGDQQVYIVLAIFGEWAQIDQVFGNKLAASERVELIENAMRSFRSRGGPHWWEDWEGFNDTKKKSQAELAPKIGNELAGCIDDIVAIHLIERELI